MKACAGLLLMLLLAGCQGAPHPAPGLAGVSIKVVAEPKAGIQSSRGRVMSYDTPDQHGYGDFARVDYSNLGQIVVWMEPDSGSGAGGPPSEPLKVEIDARRPVAEVTYIASVGQKVLIRNNGARSQIIYSVSDGNEFDGGSVAPGTRAAFTVKSAGLIDVLTESSADPVARIYAAPTKWVKLTRAGETLDFNDLPPGRYRVKSWHPRLPGSESSVNLAPNQVASVSIAVGVNGLPKIAARSVGR